MKNVSFNTAWIILLVLSFISPATQAGDLFSCHVDVESPYCIANLSSKLSIKTELGGLQQTSTSSLNISGDIELIAEGLSLPMANTRLVLKQDSNTGELLEFYGIAALPLDRWDIVKDAEIDANPPTAIIGLFQGDTIEELFNDSLPLNNGVALDKSARNSKSPYIVFHSDAGGLSYDIAAAIGLNLGEKSNFSLELPFGESMTLVLDTFDPYLYMGKGLTASFQVTSNDKSPPKLEQSKGYLPVTYSVPSTDGSSEKTVTEYYNEKDQLVSKFTHDSNSNKVIRIDHSPDGHQTFTHYIDDGKGNFTMEGDTRENAPSFSMEEVRKGVDIDNPDRIENKKKSNKNTNNKTKRKTYELGLDAIAISNHGWIPFEAETVWGIPGNNHLFSGHFYLQGAVTVDGMTVLDGDTIVHLSEDGFVMAGNGDLALKGPFGDFIDFTLFLGTASAAIEITADEQKTFISGISEPDKSMFGDIPLLPSSSLRAAAYLDSQIEKSSISMQGEYSLGTGIIGELIGVQMNDLYGVTAKVQLTGDGIVLDGVTQSQISPDIEMSGEIKVHAKFSWADPDDFVISLAGKADVYGVGLEEVAIEINSGGMFINGVFVTPLTEIAVSGNVTETGPALSGYGEVAIGLESLTQSFRDAVNTMQAAQQEVARLDLLIAQQSKIVQAERNKHKKSVSDARKKVSSLDGQISSLNNKIKSRKKSISSLKKAISNKYRWYKKAKWYQKASRWASYASYRAKKTASISAHQIVITSYQASTASLNLAIKGAKASLTLLERATVITPIELDPRVAGLISAKAIATETLNITQAPFAAVPFIDSNFKARIELDLNYLGLIGSVTAEFDGYQALSGWVELSGEPKACIDMHEFGNACTQF